MTASFLALHWAVLVGLMVLLTAFRAFDTSRIASFIDFDDVPLLRAAAVHYGSLWWTMLVLAASYAATLASFMGFRIRSRAEAALPAVVGIALISAVVAGRYVIDGDGTTGVRPIGWLDWTALAATLVATWWQAGAIHPRAGASESSSLFRGARRPAGGVALAYLLSCLAVTAYAATGHLAFWFPALNGGHLYSRFLAASEVVPANLVLFSTSALFATFASVVGISGLTGICYLTRVGRTSPTGELRSDPRRRAALAGLTWSAVLMLPWQVRLLPEIALDRSWIFPTAAVLSGVFVLTMPILISGLMLDDDLARLAEADPPASRQRRLESEPIFWSLLLFATYPLFRGIVRRASSTRAARRWLLGFGGLHIAGLTWAVANMDLWYNLPEWRGMYHATLVPSLQVFVSLLWAWLVYLIIAGHPPIVEDRADRARAGRLRTPRVLVVAAALLVAAFASWPLWGWDRVSRNVVTRTYEFNRRHEFEVRFLHWLFDRDRDGYSSVLHGPDPNDRDPNVIAPGFEPPARFAAAPDRFVVTDPAAARQFPNVVLLYLEGIAPSAISAYGRRRPVDSQGRPIAATPNIDAIARDGVVFTNARAHYPATWEGWLALNSGRDDNLGELSYLDLLHQKDHNGNLYEILQLTGINRWCHPDMDPFAALFVPERLRPSAWRPVTGGYSTWVSAEEAEAGVSHGDKRTTRMTDFLADLGPGDRFFLSEHMNDTHEPWRRTSLARARELGFEQGLDIYESDAVLPHGRRSDRYRRYFHVITRTDAEIGRIVRELKARGLYDSSLIVLVGDHGYQWNENEHEQHVAFLYDPALRIPLVIKAPGVPPGTRVNEPVMQIDLLPTLMEMAGVTHRNEADTQPFPGVSLMPLLLGTASASVSARYAQRDIMLATYFDNQGIIEGFRHKLIFGREAGTFLLFDLEQDPGELHNLADERPDLVAALMAKHQRYARAREAYLSGQVAGPR